MRKLWLGMKNQQSRIINQDYSQVCELEESCHTSEGEGEEIS